MSTPAPTSYEIFDEGIRVKDAEDTTSYAWSDIKEYRIEEHPTIAELQLLVFETKDGWDQWPLPSDISQSRAIERTLRQELGFPQA